MLIVAIIAAALIAGAFAYRRWKAGQARVQADMRRQRHIAEQEAWEHMLSEASPVAQPAKAGTFPARPETQLTGSPAAPLEPPQRVSS